MQEYIEYAIHFETVYEELRSKRDLEKDVDELCSLRPYFSREMKDTLMEMGMFHIDYFDIKDYSLSNDTLRKFGLLNKADNFLLEGGYILPVRDMEGYLIALVAWMPGQPTTYKYRTTPSKYFSKSTSIFNIDNAIELGNFEYIFVVEGIFDAVAMRSIKLPCGSIQGAEMNDTKRSILRLFKKSVGVPDNDGIGRDELISWGIGGNCTMVKMSGSVDIGGEIKRVKDCDDAIKYFDGMREAFLEAKDSKEKLFKLEL